MKRTISGMIGTGSLAHNRRDFIAENVDPDRVQLNICYQNENLKDVYEGLFDEAVERYNVGKRKDRQITNYYEKIRQGKQEKLFHEVIFQIGNREDMAVGTDEGDLAVKVLNEYVKDFQKRNPTLRVFSCYLHQDEATPHLHIDFIPYVTGWKGKGMDTRVSLKQALKSLGFQGGNKHDTEMNQWINHEKEVLAEIAKQHGIEWEQKGTHEEHLDVYNFKKKERKKEVQALEQEKEYLTAENEGLALQIAEFREDVQLLKESKKQAVRDKKVAEKRAETAEKQLKSLEERREQLQPIMDNVSKEIKEYGTVKMLLPEAGTLERAATYRDKKIKPLFLQIKNKVGAMAAQVKELTKEVENWKSTDTNIDALRVSKGQILMTCSGTIGKVSLVSNTLDGLIFSHDLLRINCKNVNDVGYVYAFLKSKIGNKILLTNSYGAVITHIEPEHLATVPIPNAPDVLKQKIGNLILRSYTLRDESNDLINTAIKMLMDELQLPKIDDMVVNYFKKDASVQTFNVKLSDMEYRLDASYHVPVVDAIIDHLKKHAAEVTIVGDKRISKSVILPGRFKRVYVDERYGRVFFGGKQLLELDPTNTKYLSVSQHDKRMKEELELKENTILITRSGTIGKTALVPKHWVNWVASEDILRIVPANEDIAGYLYIFLLSEYGAKLIERYAYGSVISHIDDAHIRQIPVPILKNHDIQEKINSLALEANKKRYEAYRLEQKALEVLDKEVIYAK